MKAAEDLWRPLCGPFTYERLTPSLVQHVGLPDMPLVHGDRRRTEALLEDFLQSPERVAVALGPPRSGKSQLVAQWAARAASASRYEPEPWRAVWVPASAAPSLPDFVRLLWDRLWEVREDFASWAPPVNGISENRTELEDLYGAAPSVFDDVAHYRRHLTGALKLHEIDEEFGGDRLLVVLDNLQAAAGWSLPDALDLTHRPAKGVKLLLVSDDVPGGDARGWADVLQLKKPPALLWLG